MEGVERGRGGGGGEGLLSFLSPPLSSRSLFCLPRTSHPNTLISGAANNFGLFLQIQMSPPKRRSASFFLTSAATTGVKTSNRYIAKKDMNWSGTTIKVFTILLEMTNVLPS